jgi:LmbE family N-acetylglucosaminyl deacetylase
MQHDPFAPTFVVDVTATWPAKMAALDAYASQIHSPARAATADGPPTKVASREFRLAVEGRGRHFGNFVGAEFGEPFASARPLAVAEPWKLLTGGLR